MKIYGVSFEKISVERKKNSLEDLKISTKIEISDINRDNFEEIATKEEFLRLKFKFIIHYDPDIAEINLEGNVLFSVESKQAKSILDQWKLKIFPKEFKAMIYNVILRKSNVRALQLEEEVNLPLHVPLPMLKQKDLENTDNSQ